MKKNNIEGKKEAGELWDKERNKHVPGARGEKPTQAITAFFELNTSAAISGIRNAFTSMKFNRQLGKTKIKVYCMKYLDGSAAVEQSLGWQDLSGCRTFTSYLNSSHGSFPCSWAAGAGKELVPVPEQELLCVPRQYPRPACCPQTQSLGASMLELFSEVKFPVPWGHVAAKALGPWSDTLCCACTAGWTMPPPLMGSFHCSPEVGLARKDGLCVMLQITVNWQWIFLAVACCPTSRRGLCKGPGRLGLLEGMQGTSKQYSQPYSGIDFLKAWSMQPPPFWATNEENCVETSLAERGLFLQKRSGTAKAVLSAVYLLQLGPTVESVHCGGSQYGRVTLAPGATRFQQALRVQKSFSIRERQKFSTGVKH
ncbi:hypothetical protein QYF61_009266 [Mycteria americana]|uniref:Uncharacterized protein n=1 Tax=Mycteria americana TaxID=33587 RepID=A0AAN7NTG8_MYCAM|nr:hypothetical protein QYF61_009266 [Mycteria americana]